MLDLSGKHVGYFSFSSDVFAKCLEVSVEMNLFILFSLQAHLYEQIAAAGITYVSIGHRRTLRNHHNRVLHISTLDPNSTEHNWHIEPISGDTIYSFPKL